MSAKRQPLLPHPISEASADIFTGCGQRDSRLPITYKTYTEYPSRSLGLGSHETRQLPPRRRPRSRECRLRTPQPVPRRHDCWEWEAVSQCELGQLEFRLWVAEGWGWPKGGESSSDEYGGSTGVSDLLGGDGDVTAAEPVGVLLYRI